MVRIGFLVPLSAFGGYLVNTTKEISNLMNYPSLALPLQRGENKISSFPPLQGGIKGGI
jgi:hypothetical protein